MARTYRALAALLSYPTGPLQAATGEIARVLAEEGIVAAPQLAAIRIFLDEVASTDIYELQAQYFALFDRSRTLSLHLFEHIHGESRDRGQVMADLITLYQSHGLDMAADELPDFLPLFLEFELTGRGLRVSTIKRVSDAVDLERQGSCIWKHRSAGASEVMVASASRPGSGAIRIE